MYGLRGAVYVKLSTLFCSNFMIKVFQLLGSIIEITPGQRSMCYRAMAIRTQR
ncbi:UNVERIFIED_CONTAM: hypothetical protein GTU68_003940 [Idotea baltica]|nr:hypothetical protein [Idotea baltica]